MNVLLYPYTDTLSQIVHQLLLTGNVEHVNVVGVGRNYPASDENTDNPRITYFNDFKSATDNIDEILITFSNNKRLHQKIIHNMQYVLSNTDCVVHCYEPLSNDELSIFDPYIRSKRVFYDCIEKLQEKEGKMYTPLEAVVVVMSSLFANSDDFNALCLLRNEFVDKGYNVTVVSTSRYAKMAGFCRFPLEIIENRVAMQSAVMSINNYFSSIEEHYAPDIILLHLCNGMLKYSDICHEDFGVVAFAISQSISSDYSKLSIPISEIDVISKENFHQIENFIKYRFGFQLDAVMVSANTINLSESEELGRVSYDSISESEAKEKMCAFEKSSGIDICGLMQDQKFIKHIVENCIEVLSKGTDEF